MDIRLIIYALLFVLCIVFNSLGWLIAGISCFVLALLFTLYLLIKSYLK